MKYSSICMLNKQLHKRTSVTMVFKEKKIAYVDLYEVCKKAD